jgi:hypothetical protein
MERTEKGKGRRDVTRLLEYTDTYAVPVFIKPICSKICFSKLLTDVLFIVFVVYLT